MLIDGNTRLIGLIGNPVEHTLSPVIHNGISEKMEIPSVYVPFQVEAEGLDQAVKGAYELNILGMNITVPHKNQVLESLVEIDEAARQIGAVNTLVRIEAKHGYKGYNTDMMGLRRQIQEDGILLKGETVVILGAGGAAKAVVYMCLLEGAEKIYLLNRTFEKAEQIADHMNRNWKNGVSEISELKKNAEGAYLAQDKVIPMLLKDYGKIQEHELIVFQATAVGLAPNDQQAVLEDAEFYRNVKIGVDLIYNPANTRFMQLVKEQGGKSYNSLKMLLYQGVTAYELWHDRVIPREIVEEVYIELKRKVYKKDNRVLIGFMGSGKTTFGKALAGKLGMQFLDTDAYIEKQAGKSIADIFAEDGEEAFRRLETDTLLYLRDHLENTVLATGGGMPLREDNARLLKETGWVFYLTAAPQVIYDRVKDSTDRPLLRGENPYGRICKLMKERKTQYELAADELVDTNSNDMEEILEVLSKPF